MKYIQIKPQIKDYDWGNPSFIPNLLGIAEDGKPKAELWIGTHESGEATVAATGEKLSQFLQKDSQNWFGQAHLEQFGPVLPLLLKVLAIDRPLSIQCHPSTIQAKEGWEREASLRTRLPKELWNYKDPNRKAEVLYALTPVTAMCAFRPLSQIIATLTLLIPESYAKYFFDIDELAPEPDKEIGKLFERLYTMDKVDLKVCIAEYISSLKAMEELPFATGDGRFLESKGIAISCYGAFPEDPGLFCPFLLNVKHLEPGEALFLEPKTLHAYVLGNGIELMSASDNVLRGGLTHKKVDVKELMKVLDIRSKQVDCTPTLKGKSGRIHILTPTEEFLLMVCPSGTYEVHDRRSIELLLCTEGEATFSCEEGTVLVKKGDCYVLAASLKDYKLEVVGKVFLAAVPL
ncbi:mannose-6-phosphate isomerase, class I [uncultured Sphaerochaeta sp.]|uniref:mannose-6-phosphate isomerase, class I n=1 Tax=uncultured Sphaerochaeta sp. TaxID=886478 RepID=UPI002A0A890C|nr:mannose-6-phosphate isomerase, class I [uncultured Sphaerochaeta sp.]